MDARISIIMSVEKTVIREMEDITKPRNVHKNHTFFVHSFESDEQGKSSHFQVGCNCMLRISATCAIPKWSLRARCFEVDFDKCHLWWKWLRVSTNNNLSTMLCTWKAGSWCRSERCWLRQRTLPLLELGKNNLELKWNNWHCGMAHVQSEPRFLLYSTCRPKDSLWIPNDRWNRFRTHVHCFRHEICKASHLTKNSKLNRSTLK